MASKTLIITDNIDNNGQAQGNIINNLNAYDLGERILSLMTNPRFLNIKCEDPGAGTMTDISGKGHDGTYTGTWTSADRLKLGRTWSLDPNGTDAFIDLGDDDDFSFGDGANDSPFTVFGLIEVVLTSSKQRIMMKRDNTNLAELREWGVYLNDDETFESIIFDESANAWELLESNASLSAGLHDYVSAYDGRGGAGAANGITHYIDGVGAASTRGVVGAYTAMENLTTHVLIGAQLDTSGLPEGFFQGDIGIQGVDGVEWSAMDAWRFHQLCLDAYSEDGETL